MEIAKTVVTTPKFAGVGCEARVTDQVVLEVEVPGGKQTINFPVLSLPAVAALLAGVAADEDVLQLIVEHTPEPEPEPEEPGPEPEEPEEVE